MLTFKEIQDKIVGVAESKNMDDLDSLSEADLEYFYRLAMLTETANKLAQLTQILDLMALMNPSPTIERVVETVSALEPTFGGINLEDIKAPECFIVERKLRERCRIPVFHDDQHGTAITVSAAFINGLKVVGKDIGKIKLVVSGAGAAALTCLNLLCKLGLNKANIVVTDIEGVVYKGRKVLMDPDKELFAVETNARTLAEVIAGADVFLGLSAGKVLTQDMVRQMADRPLILALANPEPEILPELAKAAKPDVVMATGRSDYPNQVNNVLCFPFVFRGALDVGATTINTEMEMAAVRAIAALAQA